MAKNFVGDFLFVIDTNSIALFLLGSYFRFIGRGFLTLFRLLYLF